MSRARAKLIDDFLDRNEDTLKYWLEGIERNPTITQRTITNLATSVLFGGSRAADLIFQFAGYTNKPSQEMYTPLRGGAGGGGLSGSEYSVFRQLSQLASGSRGPKVARLASEMLASGGTLTGAGSVMVDIPRAVATPTGTGGRRYPPIAVRHRTAFRYGFPGQVSAMRLKLKLGELSMCKFAQENMCQFKSSTTSDVGKQGVHTFMHNPIPYSGAYTTSGSYINQWYTWQKQLETYFDTVNTRLYRPENVLNTNTLTAFMDTSIATTTRIYPSPRTSWDMLTAFQFRDMLAYAYNMFDRQGGANVDDTGTAVRGYLPPGNYTTKVPGAALGSGAWNNVSFPNGYPNVLSGTAGGLTPWYTLDPSASTAATSGAAGAVSGGPTSVGIARKYSILYVDHQTIEFDFLNMESSDVNIDIYELSPKVDINLAEVVQGGVSYQNGGMMDPTSIWWEYIKENMDEVGPSVDFDVSTGHTAKQVTDNYDDNETTYGEQAALGSATQIAPTVQPVAGIPSRVYNDEITPLRAGYDPRGLSRFYYMKKYHIHLTPASSRHISIRKDVKRGISFDEIFNTYAGSGVASTFMLVIRGAKGIALLNSLNFGKYETGPYTVTCKWRKSASFCAIPSIVRSVKLDTRVPYQTGWDQIVRYEPEDDDMNVVRPLTQEVRD